MSTEMNLLRLMSFVSTGLWILAALAGIVIVLVNWKRLGSAAGLAIGGCGLLLVTVFFSRIAHALVGTSRDALSILAGINLATTLGDLLSFGLLLAAAVAGRQRL
jgi:hypothetical protein